jgi:hypothetical protein
MRDWRSGKLDYDRLERAGVYGKVISHNVLGRVLEDALLTNKERLKLEHPRGITVELSRGGTTSYLNGGMMVSQGLTLRTTVGEPIEYLDMDEQSATAWVNYRLANDEGETWEVLDSPRVLDGTVQGTVRGPFYHLSGRVAYDLSRAHSDPASFILSCAVRAMDPARLEDLSGKLAAITAAATN